jgi:hypothetical protein
MARVLRLNRLTRLILLGCLLAAAPSALATTAIVPADDDMIIGARAIVSGKVLSIESRFDEQQGRIYTYIRLKVQEVLKGQITERKIVIKELGGQVGDRVSVIYGNAEFAVGERVLVYLDTWKDGSLRTYQMFLGKFSIENDEKTGREFAVRHTGDEVDLIPADSGQNRGAITDRMEISAYTAMVRNRLVTNSEPSQKFEQTYYRNIPTLASPPEYIRDPNGKGIHPQFTLLSPAARWFEPDTGQPVTYTLNPNPADPVEDPQIPQLVVAPADIAAAANSWSTVQGSALRINYAGTLNDCYVWSGSPGINVVSNNCDGRNAPSPSCAGILAWGGWSGGYYNPIVINGTSFSHRITQGFVSCNPWAACNFTDHCSVQFIVTHEMGHALGLGHSQYQQATMYAIAYQIARCAVTWTDDQDAIRAVYPGAGGGPGPLTVVTSSLPGGTAGTSYSQILTASGGTQPYNWSVVSGLGSLPTGLSLSAGGTISGTPTTAGTYNFTVKVTDAAPATAQKALSIVVGAAGALPLDAQFVSQSVPTSVNPGQPFIVDIQFRNTGTQTWNGFSLFYFASQNPALNQNWGGYAVPLDNFVPIAPGQLLDVSFQATAPVTSGTYNFQWQMYKNDGTTFFGQKSTNVAIQVGSAPPPPVDSAGFVSQNVPTSMTTGQTASVSVTMSNTGTTTWAAGTYYIGSQNAQANTTWGLNRVNLASAIGPGGQSTFTFNVAAPSNAGTYNFQWQMSNGTSYFGQMSTNVAIQVSSALPGADTDSDGIPDTVESTVGRNSSVKDNDIFSVNLLFAMQQYRDFLGREGDPPGITNWTNAMQSGALTRSQVIDSFFNSQEFQGTDSPIVRLYFAYFLRIPDYAGLQNWLAAYRSGAPLANISEGFAQSPEFLQRYGSLSNGAFVTLLYQNVLGRNPDPTGLANWTNALNAGATRGQIMLGFSESPEFKGTSYNKVYVTMMYVGMLRRSPDQIGFDNWVAALNSGASGLQIIQGFLGSPEYHNRFMP